MSGDSPLIEQYAKKHDWLEVKRSSSSSGFTHISYVTPAGNLLEVVVDSRGVVTFIPL